MRVRALLFVPALAVVALGAGVSSASAATLFTSTAHSARVTPGATVSATVVGSLDLTLPVGTVQNRCTSGTIDLAVESNTDAGGVVLRAQSGTIAGCTQPVTVTYPFTVTISGNGSASGTNTTYNAVVDGIFFHLGSFGSWGGNVTSGVMALEPTSGTSPITLNLANAAGVVSASFGPSTLDGNLRLEQPYSLTN